MRKHKQLFWKFYLFLSLFSGLVLFFACDREDVDGSFPSNFKQPVVMDVKGYQIPTDSLPVISAFQFKPKRVALKAPRVMRAHKNVTLLPEHIPSVPVDTSTLQVITPGSGSVPLPEVFSAKGKKVAAGLPNVKKAKDMAFRDPNPASFSSFGKLQGLKTTVIQDMLTDRMGNLWVAMWSGGVLRYDGRQFTEYTTEEGLIDNLVTSVNEMRNGDLWFGTWNQGICRFDGHTFTQFGPTTGFFGTHVDAFYEDEARGIWFGSSEGLFLYDGNTFTLYGERQGIKHVESISGDRKGNMWLATRGGIIKFDGRSFLVLDTLSGLNDNLSNIVYEDHSGNLWIGTISGANRFDGKTMQSYTSKEGFTDAHVQSIVEDNRGNLWFGTANGLFMYDGGSFQKFTKDEGLPSNVAWTLEKDHSGNIWIGTENGLAVYKGSSFTHFTEHDGLGNNKVSHIFEARDSSLWLGQYGGGLTRYDGKQFTNYTTEQGLPDNLIFAADQEDNGDLWLATNIGIAKFDGKFFTWYNDTLKTSCLEMMKDDNGNLWFLQGGLGLVIYEPSSSGREGAFKIMATEYPGIIANGKDLLIDHHGNLWVAGDLGIMEIRLRKDGTVLSASSYTAEQGLPDAWIYSMIEDKDGIIWMATRDGGLLRCEPTDDPDRKTFFYFTEDQGLVSNNLTGLEIDRSGNIWIGTRYGLSMLSGEKAQSITEKAKTASIRSTDIFFRNFTYGDGFLGVGAGPIHEDRKGTIWVGANDRLSVVHPGAFEVDSLPPHMQLTDVALFNEKISWQEVLYKKDSTMILGNGIRVGPFSFDSISRFYNVPQNLGLKYNNNSLTFNYIGVTTNSSQGVKYQYMLDGLEKNWNIPTTETEANYGNLPYGSYTFMVKAMNSSGYWSEPFEYGFEIWPAWWQTRWFRFSLVAMVIISFILYYRWRTAAIRHRAKKLEEEVYKATRVIMNQKKTVEEEKKKSDDLLLNILPAEIAEELKTKGSADAKLIEEVTVLFTDFKDFTRISEKMTPESLVAEIDECYSEFDRIMQRHGVEKIKTIGDSYMAAGGLPTPNRTHPKDVLRAALEIQKYVSARMEERKKAGKVFFENRIGIHTGPVVAGIVGVKKYSYDIWGDTVNTANRMESACEVGKVNISGATYELVKDEFKCEYRGKISVKGKGEIDMYFVKQL